MGLNHKLEDLVDVPALTEWLDHNIPDLGSDPLRVELVHGGYSNAILSLDRGGETLVLRRPPAVPPPRSERTIMREARVLSALNGTEVPHPRCYGVCENPEVIGAPFYVMERVDGWSSKIVDQEAHNEPPFDRMPWDYRIPFAVADGLVALANVDYKAVGLEDFGKPDNYLQRQVDRWSSQLASYKEKYDYQGRDLPGYELTEQWLRDNIPRGSRPGIIHGDIGTTNMMFAHDPPARLKAMVDWELSTIGDPLVDLGWFLNGLRDERTPDVVPDVVHKSANWPTRQEIARYYAGGTGLDVDSLDYYLVLARFKGGCIMEYKVAQAEAGVLDKETGKFFARIVEECFSSAADLIRDIS